MRIVRDREMIIGDILKSAQNGENITRIMYKTMLNYSQIKKYLLFLQERTLISYDSAIQLYITTDKGMEYIKKSTVITELIQFDQP